MAKKKEKMNRLVHIVIVLVLLSILYNIPSAKAASFHSITCDGNLADWAKDEYLGDDFSKDAYFTWNATSLFVGWNGTDWSTEGDLFIYFNTSAGGSTHTIAWNSQASHTLPFAADYSLIVEKGFDVHLYKWDSNWTDISASYTGANYIGWSQNKVTEIEIPRSEIGNPTSVDVIIFAQWETEDKVWAVFPTNNPSGNSMNVTFYSYYHFHLIAGVSPDDPANIVTTVNESTPPQLRIDEPKEGEVLNESSYTIYANATDNTAVSVLKISIDGGAKQFMYGLGNGAWKYTWSGYSKGAHTITVYAYDVCGNVAEKEVNVTYAGGNSSKNPNAINLAIIWHMHQPLYKDLSTGKYLAPWTRVHLVQEYLDHAFILKRHPDMKVTINFVPALLYQIEDIARGNLTYENGKYVLENYTDPHLELALQTLNKGVSSLSPSQIQTIETEFFWISNWVFNDNDTLNKYYKYLSTLVDKGKQLSNQQILDLEVSYFLLQISKPFIKGKYGSQYRDSRLWAMLNRSGGFTYKDLAYVIQKQFDIARLVLPLYKSIKNAEFTCSPYYHPIMPLLLMPGWRGQQSGIWVNKGVWYNDTIWQLSAGKKEFKKIFGYYPDGLWPSEEAVSQAVIRPVNQTGFRWMVSDTYVLDKSGYDVIDKGSNVIKNPDYMYRAYIAEDPANHSAVYMVFRDRVLSDRIGFVYNHMSAEDAVNDFISYVERVSTYFAHPENHLVVVALDGENWMFMNNPAYADNGRDFLNLLYQKISEDPNIRPVTVDEYLKAHPPTAKIEHLATGSWIHGDLTNWEGEADEDTAWNWLAIARRALVNYTKEHGYDAHAEAGWQSLYPAEGSDWFWWYGTDETTRDEPMFDHLYKTHLINVYRAIGLNPPVYLTAAIKAPQQPDRVGRAFTPNIDGKMESEWNRAYLYKDPDSNASFAIDDVYVTYNPQSLYLLIKTHKPATDFINGKVDLSIYFSLPNADTMNLPDINYMPAYGTRVLGFPIKYRVDISFSEVLSSGVTSYAVFTARGKGQWTFETSEQLAAIGRYVEVGIPLTDLGLNMGDFVYISVVSSENDVEVDEAPNAPMKIFIPFMEKRTYIMDIHDNIGDDNGNGHYVYPTAGDMWPNKWLFDITDLKIFNTSYVLGFEFHFRSMGKVVNGKPIWNPKYGFSQQMINIYIDTDRKKGSGQINMLEGAYAQVRSDFAWEYAISARGWDVYVQKSDGTVIRNGVSAIADFNETTHTWDNNTVTVRISLSIIGKNFRHYGYVIVVGSQDEYGPGKWRIVNKNVGRWNFGGGTDTIYDPDIIDMITPREANESWIDSRTQQQILGSYNVAEKKFAVVPGIVLPSANNTGNETHNGTNENVTSSAAPNYQIPISIGIVLFAISFVGGHSVWMRTPKEKRKRIKKYGRVAIILFLIIGAIFLVIYAAPPATAKGKPVITIWYTFTRGSKEYDTFNRLIAEYQKMHPDVIIKAEWQEYSAAINKYITQANAGNPPDIIRIPNDRLGEIARMGFLEPLDGYMNPTLWRAYLPQAMDAMTYKGKLYALPASYDSLLIIYNKDLIKEKIDDKNWTLEDMVRIAENSSAEYGIVFPTTSSYWWFPFQYGFGGSIFHNGVPVVNDSASVRATEFIKSLVSRGLMPKNPVDEQTMVSYFNSGKTAMIIEGPWKISEIQLAVPHYGLAVMPKAVRHLSPLVGYKGYAISKDSKYKTLDFDLIKFLTSFHAEKEFAVNAHTSPSRWDVFADKDVEKDPIIQAMKSQAQYGQTYPNVPEMSVVQEKVTEALGKVYDTNMPPQEALDVAEQQILTKIKEGAY
ncbi:MAG: extracellular solute-binding protein [Euryarchaeota archaeon]|nr:extracellular solute-binding protein [Euryarchaeota archaeon]